MSCAFLLRGVIKVVFKMEVTPAPGLRPEFSCSRENKDVALYQDYNNPGQTRWQRATAASACCISTFRAAAFDLSSGIHRGGSPGAY